jgi:hypothetical protein
MKGQIPAAALLGVVSLGSVYGVTSSWGQAAGGAVAAAVAVLVLGHWRSSAN